MLAFLSDTDAFGKYKSLSSELISLRVDLASIERQRSYVHRLHELRVEVRTLSESKSHLQAQIEADVEKQNTDTDSLFSVIRFYFSEIIDDVIDRQALLSVTTNQYGHLEFKAEILDDSGRATSADLGHTYRKLLCIAFDFAILRAHLSEPFARFVYHDGALESLDNRKKENLLSVLRQQSELGIQSIITVIDSDLPVMSAVDPPVFGNEEIILRLHDEDEQGRLFRMQTW